MKRPLKTAFAVLAVLSASCCAGALFSGCGGEKDEADHEMAKHEHYYEIMDDENYHWEECLNEVGECDARIINKVEHNDDMYDGICDDCKSYLYDPIQELAIESELTLVNGDEYTFMPEYFPEHTKPKFVWKSSNESVATVDENGKVTVVGVGNATITVTVHKQKSATCALTVSAYTKGLTYEPVTINGTEGYKVSLTDYNIRRDVRSLVIPDTYEGKPVLEISEGAFRDSYGLKKVTIPNSVKRIGARAFMDCDKLTSITIPDSVTEIGEEAFYTCKVLKGIEVGENNANFASQDGVLYNKAKTQIISVPEGIRGSVVIPDTVTEIGEFVFQGCRGLISVTLPANLERLANTAFSDCPRLVEVYNRSSLNLYQYNYNIDALNIYTNAGGSLLSTDANGFVFLDYMDYGKILVDYTGTETDITIPSGTVMIYNYAFSLRQIKSVTIPDSVVQIGIAAFLGSTLESVDFGNGVQYIEGSAFADCGGLKSVELPDSVVSVAKSSFESCRDLKYTEEGKARYLGNASNPHMVLMKINSNSDTEFTINPATRVIASDAFTDCNALEKITIPENIRGIGERAIICSSLQEVTFNATNCEYIGERAFGSRFNTLTVGDNVTNIPEYAFMNCFGLTHATLGSGVKSIGDGAFQSCSELYKIEIPDGIEYVGERAFEGCSSLEYNTINLSKYLGNRTNRYLVLIDGCSLTGRASVHEGTKVICAGAFSSCEGLTALTLPSTVVNVDPFAFDNCNTLESIYVEAGNTAYSSDGVVLCKGNKVITIAKAATGTATIPDSVTEIDEDAFHGSHVSKIVIGSGVKNLTPETFEGCTNLSSVSVSANNPNFVSKDGALYNKALTEILVISNVSGELVIPDSVEKIGYISNLSGVTSITVGENNKVYASQDGILYDKAKTRILAVPKKLSGKVVIPDTVYEIGDYEFEWCTGITEITIGSRVERIGYHAFESCRGLVSIVLPDSVKIIGDGAFYDCEDLRDLTIGSGVTQVGISDLFFQCFDLANVVVNMKDIPNYMFSGCNKITTLTLGNGVETIGYNAFSNCSELTAVTLPDSVKEIGDNAFSSCTKLAGITVGENNANFASQGGILYDKAKTQIIYVPEAISGEVVLPDTLQSIPNSAFFSRGKLTAVTIPKSITKLDGYAFDYCYGLDTVNYMGTLEDWCNIDIAKYGYNNPLYYADTFKLWNGTEFETLTSASLPDDIDYSGQLGSAFCITEIIVPYGVTITGNFTELEGLTELKVGYTREELEAMHPATLVGTGVNITYAYGSTTGTVGGFGYIKRGSSVTLTSYTGTDEFVVLPKEIEGAAVTEFGTIFSGNENVKTVIIPSGYKKIADGAFADCTKLNYLYVSATVTEFGSDIFTGSGMPTRQVTDAEADIEYNTQGVFTESDSATQITPWMHLGGYYYDEALTSVYRVETDESSNEQTVILTRYFGTGEEPLTVPAEIDGKQFAGVGVGAFSRTAIKQISFAQCPSIMTGAFYECTSLTEVILPEMTLAIYGSAFYGCTSLTSIVIPKNVVSIGAEAFYNSGLTTAKFELATGWMVTDMNTGAMTPVTEGVISTELSTANADYLKSINSSKALMNSSAFPGQGQNEE